jgi:Cu2+-exporting ATPase
MLNILFAGAALAYTGIKLYRSLKETKVSSLAKKEDMFRKEKIMSSSDLAVNYYKKNNELPITDEVDEISRAMKENVNRDFVIASASFVVVTFGTLVYSPLTIISIAGYIYITVPIWKKGYYSLFKRHQLNMSVLDSIALPSIFLTGHYFLAGMGYWFYSLSEVMLLKTEDTSRKSLISIFGEQPNFVWVLKDDIEIEIPFDTLQVGDIVVVNAGEMIPVDGIISKGIASIDQHILTGESQPSEKGEGEQVFASTVLLSGKIHIQVEKAGKDTVAAKIGEILIATIDFKTAIQSRGQKIADSSVLPTMVTSVLALPVAGLTGTATVLLSCIGDNVRIISPLSVLNFLRIASAQGILIKDGRALELLSQVDTVVFDKTGTLTQEQPHIGKIYTFQNYQEHEVLMYAAAAEYKQKHPIAKAILQAANERKLNLPAIEEATYEIGYGIKVTFSNQTIQVGSARFMEMEGMALSEKIKPILSDAHESGHSLVMIAVDRQIVGAIELHATIRPEVKNIIKELHQRRIAVHIISGDQEKPTQRLAKELGIDNYFANTLPENKADLIQQLIDEGKVVCFVGDGINDSIALKKAHVSISLKGASTVATDTAQIVLMDASLKHLCQVFNIADELDKNLNTGLVTTIVPGIATIGGVFLLHLGIVSAIVIFNTGLLVGVGNSMLPLLKHQREE